LLLTAENFRGTDRFSNLKRLGSGGFGVVYEAYDRQRRIPVVLKVLRQNDPVLLYLFKREFRSLLDITHPNLVTLYELFSESGAWFFSMELLKGANFVRYIREERTNASVNNKRLRNGLVQLARGVRALHSFGKLHRDIKPANILVTEEQRVVLLDFGLVKDLSSQTSHNLIAGTPCYMSPEQFAQRHLTEATDWYAVGVVLYEVLTGTVPFSGDFYEVMQQKRLHEIVPPSRLVSEVPEDLERLCVDLLNRDPETRPNGTEVLRLLEHHLGDHIERAPTVVPPSDVIVGRERHGAILMEHFHLTLNGRTAIVNIRGSSGMGKTTLLQAFLTSLQETTPEAVILSSRCNEREALPFKAMDEFIDGLSRYLHSLSPAEREAIIPRDFYLVERLFPVISNIAEHRLPRGGSSEISDSHEVRKRAFLSLLTLFGRLAEKRPLIIAVDDLQWGDLDSAVFLSALVSGPTPPSLLFIGSFRSEDVSISPFLKAYHANLNSAGPNVVVSDLEVGELTTSETKQLLCSLVSSSISSLLDSE
jgi:hypothetical protein